MMKFHHFLTLLIITFLVIASKADVEADYDAGFIEHHEELPKPQPQVSQPKQQHQEEHPIIPEQSGFHPFKSFSVTEASFYIPVAIVSGVLLNVMIISALVILKRRRVSSYRKLQLNRATPVFRELQTEVI